ncbi:MAG: hypothetical protein JNM47_17495 [Hyphomonadaceae bacterium]|nr:hypothetical protein [Hyphomonadaceae bacterium]
MSWYSRARAYALALLCGGAIYSVLIWITTDKMAGPVEWLIAAQGYAIIFLLLGVLVSPLVVWATDFIQVKGLSRPASDIGLGATIAVVATLAFHLRYQINGNQFLWALACGAIAGAIVGYLSWCLGPRVN